MNILRRLSSQGSMKYNLKMSEEEKLRGMSPQALRNLVMKLQSRLDDLNEKEIKEKNVARAQEKKLVSPVAKRWKQLKGRLKVAAKLTLGLRERERNNIRNAIQHLTDIMMNPESELLDLLTKIREQIILMTSAENCYIYISLAGSRLLYDGESFTPSSRSHEGIVNKVFNSGSSIYLEDISKEIEFKDYILQIREKLKPDEAYICFPLMDNNEAVGVVEIVNPGKNKETIQNWLILRDADSMTSFLSFAGRLLKAMSLRPAHGIEKITLEEKKASTSCAVTETEQALFRSVELFLQVLHADRCTVYVVDEDAGVIWSKIAPHTKPFSVKIGTGIAGSVVQTGKYVLIEDAYTDPRFCPDYDKESGYLTKSMLCVPAFGPDQKVVAVIQMLNKVSADVFDASDVALCENLCRHVGTVLHNSRLNEAVVRAEGKAQTLLDLSSVLFRELDIHSLLVSIMNKAKIPLNAERCCIFVLDEEKGELWTPSGSELANLDIFRLSKHTGIVGNSLMTGKLVNIHDAYTDKRFNDEIDKKTGFKTRSILAVPIKDANGKILGVMEMINKISKTHFEAQDEELATAITYYLAIALNNANLFESAKSAQRKSDALLTMMQSMSSHDEVGAVFDTLVATTCHILNAENTALFLMDNLNDKLYCKIGRDVKGFIKPISWGIPGTAISLGKEVMACDVLNDKSFDPEYHDVIKMIPQNVLCVPVFSKEKVIAVLQVTNKTNGSKFNVDDIKILTALCAEISKVIERKSLLVAFEDNTFDRNDNLHQLTRTFLSQYTTNITSTEDMKATPDSQPSVRIGLLSDRVKNVTEKLISWAFDPWNYSIDELIDFTLDIFAYYDLFTYCSVDEIIFHRFAVAVKDKYRNTPYHSYYHGFTTLLVSFQVIYQQTSKGILQTDDILSILIASYCHDMNHNGRTNDFHIRSKSHYALTYNDQSVLENMHASLCFETIRKPGHDILENVKNYFQLRRNIISSILSTDMQLHSTMVTKLNDRLKWDVFNSSNPLDMELFRNCIVHSADISNPTMVPYLSRKWSSLLVQEFNLQYEEELRLGLTPAQFLNAKVDTPEQAKMNSAFIDSCVFPLWRMLHEFITGLDVCMDNIRANKSYWAGILADHENKQKHAQEDSKKIQANT